MSVVVNKPQPDGDPAYPAFAALLSANTPEFSQAQWVVNSPNLEALIGSGTPQSPQVPKRYWVVDPLASQNLREMTAPEKTVVDSSSSELGAARSQRKGELAQQAEAFLDSRYLLIQREAFAELLVRGPAIGDRAALLGYIDWLASFYVALGQALAAVDAATTVPAVESVVLATAPFIASDPLVTLPAVVPTKGRLTLGLLAVPLLVNASVTNATTNLVGASATAPANSLQPEQVYSLEWYFTYLHTAASTPSLIFELLIGGAVLATQTVTPVSVAGTYAGRVQTTFTVRTGGTSGTVVGAIIAQLMGTTQATDWGGGIVGTSPTAVNTTVSNVVKARMRMGSAVAGNTLTISQGWIERRN